MSPVARVVAVQDRHIANVLRWVNDPDLRVRIGTVRPVSETEHRDYFDRALKDPRRLFLAIEDLATGQHVGMAGLDDIDLIARDAELWLYVGEEQFRGKGHARDAFEELATIAFGTLGLHRISVSVFEFNERAERFFRARGMKVEGRRREAVFKKGRRWDLVRLGLLAREFQATHAADGPAEAVREAAGHLSCEEVIAANREFHARLADSFLETQPYGSPENRKRVRAILERIAEKAGHGRLLDVGCGTGFIPDLAHDLFAEIQGIDPTDAMLRRVTPRPNLHLQIGLVEELPFPDACFDAVTAYGVLHHLFDIERAFREIRRVLRPGSTFYADESPSYDFAAAMRALPPEDIGSEILKREHLSVVDDACRYEKDFGLPQAVVKVAMFQSKTRGGLRSTEIAEALRRAGFTFVKIVPRWFAGQGSLRKTHGDEAAALVSEHLSALLPVSAPLFKYLMIEATVDR